MKVFRVFLISFARRLAPWGLSLRGLCLGLMIALGTGEVLAATPPANAYRPSGTTTLLSSDVLTLTVGKSLTLKATVSGNSWVLILR